MKNMTTESMKNGGKIRQDTGMDKSADCGVNAKEARMGREMKGGPTDVSHSVSGGNVKRI